MWGSLFSAAKRNFGIPIPYACVIFGMLLSWGMATADKSLMAIALNCAMLTGYKVSIITER